MEVIFRSDFLKSLLPLNNQRAANKRLIFILTESVLSLKIGRWEPLSISVCKNCSRNCGQKWRSLDKRAIVFSQALNNNTPVNAKQLLKLIRL